MQAPLDQALIALIVGMSSVFLILGLIVLSGNLLIRTVNRFFPVAPSKKPSLVKSRPTSDKPSPTQLAVITAAVEFFTKGKGQIRKIEKITEDQ